MLKDARRSVKVETGLAALSGLLGLVTLVWHDWLEVTGWDPDHHSGSAELVVAAALLVVGLALGAFARREHRRDVVRIGHSAA